MYVESLFATLNCLAPGDNYPDAVVIWHRWSHYCQLFGRVKGPIVLEKVGFLHQAETTTFQHTRLLWLTFYHKSHHSLKVLTFYHKIQHSTETVLLWVIKSIHQRPQTTDTSKTLLLHDNVRNHKAKVTVTFQKKQSIQVLAQVIYKADLAPCDNWLFTTISVKVGWLESLLHLGPHRSSKFRWVQSRGEYLEGMWMLLIKQTITYSFVHPLLYTYI